ncbi:MAG: DUF2125 domain-containing protein [Paracoccaceae bacterium]
MRILNKLGGTSALALMLAAQTASADVTAKEVWENWRDYMVSMGYEVAASTDMSGDVLTVSGIDMSMDFEPDDGTVSMNMDSITFSENGDGTVSIQVPEVMPIKISFATENEPNVNLQIDYRHDDLVITASGVPDDMSYDMTADQLSMKLESLDVEGEDVSADDVNFMLTMANVAGVSTMKTAESRTIGQDFTADSLTYDIDFTDPVEGGRGMFKGAVSGIKFTGTGDLPLEVDTSDVTAMLAAGFSIDGGFEYQSGSGEFKAEGPDGNVEGSSSSEGGTAKVRMNQSELIYDVAAQNSVVNISGDEIPFGIGFNMDEALFKLAMPISKSDEEQDFGFALTLGNFAMDETLWNLFDPSAALPRDPATISLDLEGKAKVLVDFLDPEQAALLDQSGAVPGELNALTLKNLLVSAAGATLTGMGDFVFDNTQDFNGMPKPTGAVDLKLVGGNGLIDKLVMMGMLPDEQAMGARMMMGLFAVPGDAPDTLNSKIEINDEGHVLANGQRIQ